MTIERFEEQVVAIPGAARGNGRVFLGVVSLAAETDRGEDGGRR